MLKKLTKICCGMAVLAACFLPLNAQAGAGKIEEHMALPTAEKRLVQDFLWAEMPQEHIQKVRLVWPLVPDAVKYELVITKGNASTADAIVTTKEKIYTNGYELDTSVFDVIRDNLYWKIRGLDENGQPLSEYTTAKPLQDAEINPQAPLATTEFTEMDYTPLYPVYSWIPYLHAQEYELQVFYDDDNNTQTPDQLLKTDWVVGGGSYDYYEDTAYTRQGRYWWRVRAKDAATNPISEWSQRSYFFVPGKPVEVAALGDSITHGGGAVSTPPGYRMYNWETYAGLPVMNMGVSGNTVEAMNNRFETDVLPFKPKILVILGGINNIRSGDSAQQVIQGLSTLQYKCMINHITPVFVTVAPINPLKMKSVAGLIAAPDWKRQQEKINSWVASQVFYVDITPRLTDWRGWLSDSLTTDGLHPDMQGKQIIGQTIGGYIKEKFPKDMGLR